MSLLNKFLSYIKKEDLFHPGDKLIIAVSGGVDSVVLTQLCKRGGFSFELAHCNFNLRKDEVEHERKLVEDLARKSGCVVHVKEFDTEGCISEHKVSVQVAARELRYQWFTCLLHETGARYLVTAHHADDNVETLLMNFFKGTGIKGLKAILPKQGNIVRPLLFAKKQELINFAAENNLDFATDSSNSSDKYSRNYFRHHVIPVVEKVFTAADDNLLKSIDRFREINSLYDEAIALKKKKLLEYKGTEVHIPVLKLQKMEAVSTITYEIIRDFNFQSTQVPEVLKLLNSESGKYVDSSTHRILKNRKWLIISAKAAEDSSNYLIEEKDSTIHFAGKILKVNKVSAEEHKLSANASIAQLDAALVTFPLIVRKWKQGDYFYPLGMQKKKKLSRFFIDQKLSKNDKGNVWVMEMNKKIVWIIGFRIDDRFKIKPGSGKVLTIEVVDEK